MINHIRIFVTLSLVSSAVLTFFLEAPSLEAMESPSAAGSMDGVLRWQGLDHLYVGLEAYAGGESAGGKRNLALAKSSFEYLESLERTEDEAKIARHFLRKIKEEEKLASLHDIDPEIQQLLLKVAKGEKWAQRALGKAHLKGRQTEIDHAEAFFWLDQYVSGFPMHKEECKYLDEKTAEQVCSARVALAAMYCEGKGVPQNKCKAIILLQGVESMQSMKLSRPLVAAVSRAKYKAALGFLEEPTMEGNEQAAELYLTYAAKEGISQASVLLNLIAIKKQGVESYVENILRADDGPLTKNDRKKKGIRFLDGYRRELDVIEDISNDFNELSKIALSHLLAAAERGNREAIKELGKIRNGGKHQKLIEEKSEILRHVLSDIESARSSTPLGQTAKLQKQALAEKQKPAQTPKGEQRALKSLGPTMSSSKSTKSKNAERSDAAPEIVPSMAKLASTPPPLVSRRVNTPVAETLATNLALAITPSPRAVENLVAYEERALEAELVPKHLEIDVIQDAAGQVAPRMKKTRLVNTLIRRSSRGKMHPVAEDGSFIKGEESEEKSGKGKKHFYSSKKSLALVSPRVEFDPPVKHRGDFISLSQSERSERSCGSKSDKRSEMRRSIANGEFKSLTGLLRDRELCYLSQVQLDEKTIRDTLSLLKEKGIIEMAEASGKIRATLISEELIKEYFEAFGNVGKSIIPSLTIHLHNHDKKWPQQKRVRQHFLEFIAHCGLAPNTIIWDAAENGEEGDNAAEGAC